jgi:hypothetical protein
MTHDRTSAQKLIAATVMMCLLGAGLTRGAVVAVLVAPAAGYPATKQETSGNPPEPPWPDYVLLRFAGAAGRQIGSEERREAVAQALAASAVAAHVLICQDGAAPVSGAAFDRLCAEPDQAAAPLWWDGAIAIHRGAVTTVTGTIQLALGEGPSQHAPVFFVPPPVVLLGSLSEAETEGAALRAMSAQLAAMPELSRWFGRLADQPGLRRAALVDDPATGLAPPPYEQHAKGGGSGVAPAPVSATGAGTTPLAPAGATGSAALAPAATATVSGAIAKEKPAGATGGIEAAFEVRQAVIGKGFGLGVDGTLRIGKEGVSFSRQGVAQPEWTIRWPDLAAAARDGGLWDAPFPLVLRERNGTRHYLARIGDHERYLDGGPILLMIARARGAFPRLSGETAKP